MTVGLDMMVQIGLMADFKRQVLKWDGTAVPMKETSNFLVQTDLTSCEMRKVVIQTS